MAEKIEVQPSDDPLKYLRDKTGGTKFKLQPVSLGYVERAIKALNNSKSPGADRIPVRCHKLSVETTDTDIQCIFRKGYFPPDLEISQGNTYS